MKTYFERLGELIPRGRENALPMKDLATILNISERAVRILVQKAREHGEPICSEWDGSGGYFYPVDMQEARDYIRKQKARIKSSRAALRGVEKYLQFFAVDDIVE